MIHVSDVLVDFGLEYAPCLVCLLVADSAKLKLGLSWVGGDSWHAQSGQGSGGGDRVQDSKTEEHQSKD